MRTALLASALALTLSSTLAFSETTVVDELLAQAKFCSATAMAEFTACGNQTLDDFWVGTARCINESDAKDRKECYDDVRASSSEANALCRDQRDARLALCKAIGESRYDPEFETADFESDYAHPGTTNPYFPL